jgi:hypothetical protein
MLQLTLALTLSRKGTVRWWNIYGKRIVEEVRFSGPVMFRRVRRAAKSTC